MLRQHTPPPVAVAVYTWAMTSDDATDDFEDDDEISEVERLRAALREAVEIIEGTGLDASVQRAALRQEV